MSASIVRIRDGRPGDDEPMPHESDLGQPVHVPGATDASALRAQLAPMGGEFVQIRLPPGSWSLPAWSTDGGTLAVASRTEILVVRDFGRVVAARIQPFNREIIELVVSPDGRYIAALGDTRLRGRTPLDDIGPSVQVQRITTIKLWDAWSGRLLDSVDSVQAAALSFGPHSDLIVTGHTDSLRVWHLTNGRLAAPKKLPGGYRNVIAIALEPSGDFLAIAADYSTVLVRSLEPGNVTMTIDGLDGQVSALAYATEIGTGLLSAAVLDRAIQVRRVGDMSLVASLEGHTELISSLGNFGRDSFLLSESEDQDIRLWDRQTLECRLVIKNLTKIVPTESRYKRAAAGCPGHSAIAIVSDSDVVPGARVLTVWTFGASLGESHQAELSKVKYTTAKVVLLGDSGVGKTGLGWRVAHGDFREHSSTHGQQFWLLDQLRDTRPDGTQCEAILWDLAGQPDYRLIHALFLDDADVALILFDATHSDDPMQGVDYWLRQLGFGTTDNAPAAILVAARSDRGTARMTPADMAEFASRRGARSVIVTSARTGRGLDELVAGIRDAIDWERRPTTVTTTTFKLIKDYVLRLKEPEETSRVILSPADLRRLLEDGDIADGFSDEEMMSAVGHLSNHGYVSILKTSRGESRILLAPELLNNIASSIVLEARQNPKGLGSLEERRVLAGEYQFPELADLRPEEQEILLDSAVAMFLQHNVCFREADPLNSTVYLVFPALINLKRPDLDEAQPIENGPSYTIVGAVENVYASLVVLLGYTSTFTRANQWRDQARYVVGDGLVCGFRLEGEYDAGELNFVLYFGTTVGQPIRNLFQSLFESFLARRHLTVRRYEPIHCPAGHHLNRSVVRELMAEGVDRTFCNRCGSTTALPSATDPIRLEKAEAEAFEVQHRAAALRSRFEQAAFRLKTYWDQTAPAPLECFISYAWGDPDQEKWVEQLASDLAKAGAEVILDRWENNRIGASVSRFVERIEAADRVIIVGSRSYRSKYENRDPERGRVVAAEADLIAKRLLGAEAAKLTVLPVLYDGTEETSFQPLLRGRVYADFRDSDAYFETALNLVLSLYEISPRSPLSVELNEKFRRI
jgi:small GTP-binding protein